MIRPIECSPDGNTVRCICDHCGFDGDIDADAIRFGQKPDRGKDFQYLHVICPNCGINSCHPVVGAERCRREVQMMFAYRLNHDPDYPAATPGEAIPAIREMIEQLGEGEKFALGDWEP